MSALESIAVVISIIPGFLAVMILSRPYTRQIRTSERANFLFVWALFGASGFPAIVWLYSSVLGWSPWLLAIIPMSLLMLGLSLGLQFAFWTALGKLWRLVRP